MLLVFFTLTVFMLVLLLEVQKGCNGDVDTCIYDNFSYPNYSLTTCIRTPWHNLQTKGFRITEDALYIDIQHTVVIIVQLAVTYKNLFFPSHFRMVLVLLKRLRAVMFSK